MNKIAEELDAKMRSLDHLRAEKLAEMVRVAMKAIELTAPIDPMLGVDLGWPEGYFAKTAGAFANEPFERVQGEMQKRESW